MQNNGYRFEKVLKPCVDKVKNWYVHEGNELMGKLLADASFELECSYERYRDFDREIIVHRLKVSLPEDVYFDLHDQLQKIGQGLRERLNEVALSEVGDETISDVLFSPFGAYSVEVMPRPEPEALRRIWSEGCPLRIFLSHKVSDKVNVAMLSNRLSLFGISAFVAHKDIKPTKVWQEEIENALCSMHALVALVGDNFHTGNWTDQEVGFALGRNVKVISVKLANTDPKGFIAKSQAITSSWDGLERKIFSLLIDMPQWKDAYISAVKHCCSFEDGMWLSKLLPKIDSLSPKQIADLLSAANGNEKIYNCYGFLGAYGAAGNGLVDHLKRWTSVDYEFSNKTFHRATPPPRQVDDDMPF